MPRKNADKIVNKQKLSLVSKIGLGFVLTALLFAVLTYFPIVSQEFLYVTKHSSLPFGGLINKGADNVDGTSGVSSVTEIKPVDTDFGIVVPKIGANVHVVADVNPNDSYAYQVALTKGVAHAKGTATPDKFGNVFLFAHSSDNFFNANRYNSVFYLLHHLENGDTFDIYYKGQKYEYVVTEKSIVDPARIDYMSQPKDQYTATLMTCWPPGTTLKRLVVVGKQL